MALSIAQMETRDPFGKSELLFPPYEAALDIALKHVSHIASLDMEGGEPGALLGPDAKGQLGGLEFSQYLSGENPKAWVQSFAKAGWELLQPFFKQAGGRLSFLGTSCFGVGI